jgi:subtilisin family serine protease
MSRKASVRRPSRIRLFVELLETRALLSASGLLHTLAFPNDPGYTGGGQWDMGGGYGDNAAAAWAAGYTGLDRTASAVGVIDEGIQYTHPDLAGRVYNPGEIAGNHIDDDHNGFVDDAYGWDFYFNNNTIYDGGKRGNQDDHGTHVAGIIGAIGNNGKGIAGTDWNVDMISAKFLGPGGYGSDAGAIAAINYLVDLKVNHGVNIVVANASWGGGGYDGDLYNAISRANDANILFVAAAGNNGANNDTTPFYPADYNLPNVITVTAIDKNGNMPSWANYGANTVDIGAPGVNILSTVPYNGYAYYSGTSMATPHVTGAIALYAAYHPDATAADIKAALLSSAAPTPSLAGKTVTGGRLDVLSFLNTAPHSTATSTVVAAASGTSGGTRKAAAFGVIVFSQDPTYATLPQTNRAIEAPAVQGYTAGVPIPAAPLATTSPGTPILAREEHVLGDPEAQAQLDSQSQPQQQAPPQAQPQQQAPMPGRAPVGEGLGLPDATAVETGAATFPWAEVFTEGGEALLEMVPQTPASEAGLVVVALAMALGGGFRGTLPADRAGERRRYWSIGPR